MAQITPFGPIAVVVGPRTERQRPADRCSRRLGTTAAGRLLTGSGTAQTSTVDAVVRTARPEQTALTETGRYCYREFRVDVSFHGIDAEGIRVVDARYRAATADTPINWLTVEDAGPWIGRSRDARESFGEEVATAVADEL